MINNNNIYQWKCGCIWYFEKLGSGRNLWRVIHRCQEHDEPNVRNADEIIVENTDFDKIQHLTILELSLLKLKNFSGGKKYE